MTRVSLLITVLGLLQLACSSPLKPPPRFHGIKNANKGYGNPKDGYYFFNDTSKSGNGGLIRYDQDYLIQVATPPRVAGADYTFTITNNCKDTIWPAWWGEKTDNPAIVTSGGIKLEPGRTTGPFTLFAGWAGRVWGRTECRSDTKGNFMCDTGDCGGKLECKSVGDGTRPATLAEFTLLPGPVGTGGNWYDISIVDGFNLPLEIVVPRGCNSTACSTPIEKWKCPTNNRKRNNWNFDMAVRSLHNPNQVVSCQSACLATRDVNVTVTANQPEHDRYCCMNKYNDQATCGAYEWSRLFKENCWFTYSWADDPASFVQYCHQLSFGVTFCPKAL